jgi:hypothetical protein
MTFEWWRSSWRVVSPKPRPPVAPESREPRCEAGSRLGSTSSSLGERNPGTVTGPADTCDGFRKSSMRTFSGCTSAMVASRVTAAISIVCGSPWTCDIPPSSRSASRLWPAFFRTKSAAWRARVVSASTPTPSTGHACFHNTGRVRSTYAQLCWSPGRSVSAWKAIPACSCAVSYTPTDTGAPIASKVARTRIRATCSRIGRRTFVTSSPPRVAGSEFILRNAEDGNSQSPAATTSHSWTALSVRSNNEIVPGAGLEPASPFGQWCLRPSRLPNFAIRAYPEE